MLLPRITGTLSIGVPGLDVLSVARRGKYGASVVQVGGMTVSAALQRLFDTVAPGFPVSIAPSTATLPASYELWDRDPAEDWTEIAAMAGMVVRTDRLGTITVRPDPDPTAVVADWQEGPACPVVELKSGTKTSTIPRRVVVVSTSPDVTPPVVGVWTNPDADSQTIVTEQRIESSTVTTVAAAESLARMSGERWARPQQSVQVTVPARPDLGYRDPVAYLYKAWRNKKTQTSSQYSLFADDAKARSDKLSCTDVVHILRRRLRIRVCMARENESHNLTKRHF
jgi:hypothetical protein